MLEEIVKLIQDTLFEGSDYCFQQVSAPAHIAKEVQQRVTEKEPDFIETNKRSSGSTNLNPLDYLLWNCLEITYTCRHINLAILNASIVKAAQQIPSKTTWESIDD